MILYLLAVWLLGSMGGRRFFFFFFFFSYTNLEMLKKALVMDGPFDLISLLTVMIAFE